MFGNSHFLYQSIKGIVEWLLPSKCILCGYAANNTVPLCKPCQHELPILPKHCEQCARFLTFSTFLKCGACLHKPPEFNRTFALFPYESPIKSWITQLKFHHKLYYANALGKLMAHKIESCWYDKSTLPDLIIPVPLHTKRLQERGFNQSVEIARAIAKKLKIPVDYAGIKRIRYTQIQSGLPAHERKSNIDHAFSLSRNYNGLHIALIDDVMTTGHTVNECAKILKKNGAKMIDVWCAARNG